MHPKLKHPKFKYRIHTQLQSDPEYKQPRIVLNHFSHGGPIDVLLAEGGGTCICPVPNYVGLLKS